MSIFHGFVFLVFHLCNFTKLCKGPWKTVPSGRRSIFRQLKRIWHSAMHPKYYTGHRWLRYHLLHFFASQSFAFNDLLRPHSTLNIIVEDAVAKDTAAVTLDPQLQRWQWQNVASQFMFCRYAQIQSRCLVLSKETWAKRAAAPVCALPIYPSTYNVLCDQVTLMEWWNSFYSKVWVS